MNWHKKNRCVYIDFLFNIMINYLQIALFFFSLIFLFSYNKSYYLLKFVLLVFMSHNLNIISFLIQSEIVNLVSIRYDTVRYYSVIISGPTINSPVPAFV